MNIKGHKEREKPHYLKSKEKQARWHSLSKRTKSARNTCQVGEKRAIKGNKVMELIDATLPQITEETSIEALQLGLFFFSNIIQGNQS